MDEIGADGRDLSFVTVTVTDQGKGIPAQEQARIFERLYRSPSVQHQIPGSGLGLSIAQNIVRAHHGELAVASRPGETTFRLTFPAGGKAGSSGPTSRSCGIPPAW